MDLAKLNTCELDELIQGCKMGVLVVFFQTNEFTGAVCNPDQSATTATALIYAAPRNQFPVTVKREGRPNISVVVDYAEGRDDVLSMLVALDGVKRSGDLYNANETGLAPAQLTRQNQTGMIRSMELDNS